MKASALMLSMLGVGAKSPGCRRMLFPEHGQPADWAREALQHLLSGSDRLAPVEAHANTSDASCSYRHRRQINGGSDSLAGVTVIR
jgi:hypothetical protein